MPERLHAIDDPNLAALDQVAKSLGDLRHEIAFVGGAVVGTLITDPAASKPRVTKDVDIITEVVSTVDYQAMLAPRLRALGFSEDMGASDRKPILCRWYVQGTCVDVMPTDAKALGFTNRWYKDALRYAKDVRSVSRSGQKRCLRKP